MLLLWWTLWIVVGFFAGWALLGIIYGDQATRGFRHAQRLSFFIVGLLACMYLHSAHRNYVPFVATLIGFLLYHAWEEIGLIQTKRFFKLHPERR